MRLTVSKYLARLTDRATSMFWGDAPLGDTSLAVGALSPASWHFEQQSIDPANGERPSGVKEGLSAESEGGGRRSPEQWVEKGREDQLGEWSQRRGGEEGGVSR